MTIETTHPAPIDQLLLPGQAAAPDGPVDVYMMYVMHFAFRRDLNAFATAVPRTPLADRAAWQALQRRWTLFADVLHHHHEGEDTGLWPFLLERADDPGRATLQAMEDEHSGIDPILDGCAADLATLAERPDAEVRDALAARLTTAVSNLGQHLGHEERDAMRLVQELMTAAEWAEVIKASFEGDLPFRTQITLAAWVMYELPAAGRRRVLAEAPLVMKVVWWLTRGGFTRRERATFAHAA